MISVKNLTKVYKSHQRQDNFLADLFFRKYKETIALDKISFEIGNNELVGFIGPNGAGKTTTLKILSGILFPTAGDIKVLGHVPFEKEPEFLKQISFVMGQRNQLIWDLPAIDSFKLNQEVYEVPDSVFKKTIDELSSLLDCHKLIDQPVKTLSLGERMKMELIAALLHRPKIIFLDEPTIGLDVFSQEAVRNFIKQFQKEFKTTIILTSHYLEDVKRMAQRLIMINKGKIVYDGSMQEIFVKYSHTKFVTIILEEKINDRILSSLGEIISYDFPRVVLKIKKDELPEKIHIINDNLPFSDLTVEEERIEEVIKNIFR